MNAHLQSFKRFWGSQAPSSAAERVVATLGGIISLSLITLLSYAMTGAQGAALVVPSMGAATVLLFAAPHGPLSQPWALFGGNLLSALVGVLCTKFIGVSALSAGLAVGLAIGAMHLARCIHPPGGATALAAVIGGPAIHDLGFTYLLTPVLLNCVIICVTAVIFNSMFPWRRYPQSFMRYASVASDKGHRAGAITTSHIEQAIRELQVFVDISADELKTIYKHASDIALREKTGLLDIEPGGFYTNGRPGHEWTVRQIVDVYAHQNPRHYMIIYRNVEGKGVHATGSCTLAEFSEWAQQRMRPTTTRP